MPEFLNIQPSPISLIESLREIGYSMETAIADIMDNSISADIKRRIDQITACPN